MSWGPSVRPSAAAAVAVAAVAANSLALLVGAGPAQAAPTPNTPRVLAISIDGLNVDALERLGPAGAPHFHRLLDQGASTLNARTEREQTITLPNHTGMLTGRRIDKDSGGHGVTWNDDRPGTTVQQGAGHPVASVFSVVHRAGRGTALFSTKAKFSLFDRSWGRAIDRFRVDERQAALVRSARQDLVDHRRAFTFLHISLPDRAGHEHGFMSARYLDAVRRTDRLVGKVLATIDHHRALKRKLVVILTADHGGRGASHSDPRRLANYRVPFLAWGPRVAARNLYRLNPDYADPGRTLPDYAGRQPVRNGDVANLATDLLGLRAVPGSELDAAQNLDVR
jgi:predicted AlkP superfamily pyrophosphatase or phosphodiesterase